MVFSNVYGFLFMFSGLEASGSDTDIIVNGILGESATFPLNIQPSQKVASISWHSKTSVAFVIPGNFGAEPLVTITHQNYRERISVSAQNYNLELRNLRIEDSGIYKADINVETSKTTTTRSYNLQVYHITMNPHTRHTGLMSGLAVLSLLIIILPSVVLFLLCKRREVRTLNIRVNHLEKFIHIFMYCGSMLVYDSDASSKKTIYTYITVSRNTQPAESRIYDEIPPSKVLPTKEEPVNTIYSLMHYSNKVKKITMKDKFEPSCLGGK
ncbi:hypothetical protein FD754_004756, partial [Muntiacus muntjak]